MYLNTILITKFLVITIYMSTCCGPSFVNQWAVKPRTHVEASRCLQSMYDVHHNLFHHNLSHVSALFRRVHPRGASSTRNEQSPIAPNNSPLPLIKKKDNGYLTGNKKKKIIKDKVLFILFIFYNNFNLILKIFFILFIS